VTIEYRTARWPEREMVRETTRPVALDRMREFLSAGVPPDEGRMRTKGTSDWPARWIAKPQLMDRIEERSAAMPFGTVLLVQRENDREVMSLMKLERDVVADLGCQPQLEVMHAFVWEKYDVRSGGRFLCRFIDGTHTVSRHGFWLPDGKGGWTWRGSAEDVFVTEGGMTMQEKMATDVVSEFKNKGLIECISNRRIWTPSQGWHPYGGNPHYHMHAAFGGGIACRP
jgi:hypothetical protein